ALARVYSFCGSPEDRQPPPEEFGCSLTIAIAAITGDQKYIVTGSDRLLSMGDGVVQGTDSALKSRRIARSWGLMFAGDASLFLPIVDKVLDRLGSVDPKSECDLEEVQSVVADVYRETFDARFTSGYLVRYGFRNIVDFRSTGLVQFGDEKFASSRNRVGDFSRF
ncbi:MAG: hypothetical protein ACLPOA_04995, partial [Methylocella sp.]